jgi:hypothetical protein
MVTAPEATALLAIAAGFDNRKPDRDTVRAWTEALADVDYDDARTVVINHFHESTEWLMPAHIVKGVRAIEAERVAAAPNLYELEPPRRVTDLDGEAFDAAYMDWLQESARRVRRGLPVETGERAPAVDDADRVRELVASVRVAHRAS